MSTYYSIAHKMTYWNLPNESKQSCLKKKNICSKLKTKLYASKIYIYSGTNAKIKKTLSDK